MLNDAEDRMIDTIIREQGLTEENCLFGLTEQQRRVWVHWALLGWTEAELLDRLFDKRKNATLSTVRYVLADAQLRILDNILRDYDLVMEGTIRPRMARNLQRALDKINEMKSKKGGKWLNPKLKKSKSKDC